jgi:hypothetical protein
LVKSFEKNPRHHTVATFQTNYIGRQRYDQYIPTNVFRRYVPTVSPTDFICRYIPTDFETKLFPSVRITDEKIPWVIPLVFADFLVVTSRGDHFRFGSVFIKKVTKLNFFLKKPKPNRNRFKPTGFGLVFWTKTGSKRFGSVFSVWFGFFSGSVSVRFCSVFSISGL